MGEGGESEDVVHAQGLRERLQLVSLYLLSCRGAIAEDMRRRLGRKQYWIEDIEMYSYNVRCCCLRVFVY